MDVDTRETYSRRLVILKMRAALMGWDTPPHILMEIEDIEKAHQCFVLYRRYEEQSYFSPYAPIADA